MLMRIEKGNVSDVSKQHEGWFVGNFISEGSFLKTQALEVKWVQRNKGEIKKGVISTKSTKTLVLMLSGNFLLRFPDIEEEVILSNEGDFVCFDTAEGLHESEALEDSKVIVIRWPSV